MSTVTLALYLRISDEDKDLKQAGKTESNSVANQRNLLREFIGRTPELAGVRVVEFCDDGWSGKNFDRPAVKEMLEQVKQGKIQCIVVKDLSRFGRDYLTVGNYLSRVFPFLGIRFIAVNDGYDSIRPMDIDSLEMSFKTLIHDLYSRELSRKVRAAKRFKAQRGDFLSPFAPYGYVKDPLNKNRLLIDPEAAETVRHIFKLMTEGQNTVQIAKTLNNEFMPTPMLYKRAAGCSRTIWPCIDEENFWTHNTVTRILRDERYVGRAVYGKRMRDIVGDIHTIKIGKQDWITADETHDGIVTQVEFESAQACLQEFVEHDVWTLGNNRLFYRKVRCGVCGHCMERVNAKAPYYVCSTSRVTAAYSCTDEHIPESDLADAVLDALHAQALYAVDAGRIWEEQHSRKKRDNGVALKTLTNLKGASVQIAGEMKELYERFALGGCNKAEYLAVKSATVKKRDHIATRIRALEAELENTSESGRLANHYVDSFQKYVEVENLTNEIVADVLQEVVVHPNHALGIVWNYREDLEKLLLDIVPMMK